MKKQYQGFMGQDLALYCYVESSVPFTVTWSHGNTPLSNPTNYVKNVNSSLWVNSGAGNEFTCTARNIAGVSSQTTTVSFSSKYISLLFIALKFIPTSKLTFSFTSKRLLFLNIAP